ncbi:MAG: winged helix DNA-binding domain-containing protein [Planctomycetota bacterium]|nr:winged helix DNA-binding domain-containing protein [Planctomycetota bacterium]
MPLATARTLLAAGLALAKPRNQCNGPDDVHAMIDRLGFVQLDSISVVERAHHHILYTRLDGYEAGHLEELQSTGRVFEHWTHDASIIPASFFPMWKHRFDKVAWGSWLRQQMGRNYKKTLEEVRLRIEHEGPLMARHFEAPNRKSGPWWDWKPAKAALEYWWRTGELAIPRREQFQKVYDLTHRVLPNEILAREHSSQEYVDWSCRSALERLGVATPRELAQFWGGITPAAAAAWCVKAERLGEIVPVQVEGTSGSAVRRAVAFPDWAQRAAAAREGASEHEQMRLLSPFDPLIRDRARCLRLFGFDYRFEAFVPEPKRTYGYYVLPVLWSQGSESKLVARVNPAMLRSEEVLHIKGVWWESTQRPTKRLRSMLEEATARYAAWMGATRVQWDVRP